MLSHKTFHDKLMYCSLRFAAIISKSFFMVLGIIEFQLRSRLVSLFDFSTIDSSKGIDWSLRLTLTRLNVRKLLVLIPYSSFSV